MNKQIVMASAHDPSRRNRHAMVCTHSTLILGISNGKKLFAIKPKNPI